MLNQEGWQETKNQERKNVNLKRHVWKKIKNIFGSNNYQWDENTYYFRQNFNQMSSWYSYEKFILIV